jgi:meiotically up-regulated gene 157 (Mug157) protein
MSLLVQAQTSDDDEEIMGCLQLVLNSSSKLGLIHESVNVNYAHSYTRKYLPNLPLVPLRVELFDADMGWVRVGSWFAWANGVFAETILNLAKRKPHLIFEDSRPYEV